MDHLAILSQTIADHARKVAYEEWENEHGNFPNEILTNAGLAKTGSTATPAVRGHHTGGGLAISLPPPNR
jgi:hypothetical protein